MTFKKNDTVIMITDRHEDRGIYRDMVGKISHVYPDYIYLNIERETVPEDEIEYDEEEWNDMMYDEGNDTPYSFYLRDLRTLLLRVLPGDIRLVESTAELMSRKIHQMWSRFEARQAKVSVDF